MQAILGKLMPLIFVGASALAATSLVMISLLNSVESSKRCLACAYLVLFGLLFLSSLGAFLLFQYMEDITEESAGVLGEIEAEILVRAKRGSCFYGKQMLRRSFSARLFRRRIMRMKLGEFRNIEAGFALDFLLQTADNIVTYVFMVNFDTPMWLF